MKKSEFKTLLKDAELVAGKRRYRTIGEREIQIMADLDRKRSLSGKYIRVYSRDGFVPNNYSKYPLMDYIERFYTDEGFKKFKISQSCAKRSNGRGSLITVENRAYSVI